MEKDELTYNIIGCAMKVHNKLGGGFQEVIYQRCLVIELERAGLGFGREQEHTIFYDGNYTVAYDFPKGLLINLGSKSLEYKLIFNPKYNIKMAFME